MTRVQLTIVAPLLEGQGLCAGCELVLSEAGVAKSPAERALSSYPADWQADYRRLLEWVAWLAARYGDGLEIRVVDPRSAAGLVTSVRHRVRRYPTFIVDGRTRIVGWQREALEAALGQAAVPRGETDAGAEPAAD